MRNVFPVDCKLVFRQQAPHNAPMQAETIQTQLNRKLKRLRFAPPTHQIYNPLEYASKSAHMYLERYFHPGAEALFLGMNPGPWGMAQTGVPFGEVSFARDWLGLEAPVSRPKKEHPKRPIEGFACQRSEVSGRRMWGWAQERFGTPERFFKRFFVWNYCPLVFMEESGKNRTPDKLPIEEREPLFKACDKALVALTLLLEPKMVIGVGKFAQGRAAKALQKLDIPVHTVLHPSPASPMANRGWAPQAEKQLKALGLKLP